MFASAERFFVRTVQLDPASPAQPQVELALESVAPFPLAQLYWGFLLAEGGKEALVYAAHRRRFSAEETQAWNDSDLVVPAFLAVAGAATGRPSLVIHAGGKILTGVAFRAGPGALPAAIVARGFPEASSAADRDALVQDLAGRAGLDAGLAVFVGGNPGAESSGAGLKFTLVGEGAPTAPGLTVDEPVVTHLDVRDREFLAERGEARRRSGLMWMGLCAGLALAGLAVVVEAGTLALRRQKNEQRALVDSRRDEVQRLEGEHTLASRVEELSRQRLLAFEMIALINEKRPASIQFLRTSTRGRNSIEVEAQTANAGDVSEYESALRGLSVIGELKTRDIRSREGVTTFVLNVTFRPEALSSGKEAK